MKVKFLFFTFLLNLLWAEDVFARAGGGGSSGGSSGGIDGGFLLLLIIVFPIFLIVQKYRDKKLKAAIKLASSKDTIWTEKNLKDQARKIFFDFQKDWSDFNIKSMQKYLADDYYKKMVLELNVLKNENRQNFVKNPKISWLDIMSIDDELDDKRDSFVVEINAHANDILFDNKNNRELYSDKQPFIEYWHFVRDGNEWKLKTIKQETEDSSSKRKEIEEFANKNNFFYDPDFGWLMMPNKGAIFNETSFKASDINNHVIGYFRDKIVEFYSYIPHPNSKFPKEFIVAQAVLPKKYNDIFVRKKNVLFNLKPKGLDKIEMESNDFNEKFVVYADPQDKVNSFELLAPNFMEKIYQLPFELNIEVVDNFLYLYTEKQKGVGYDKMLEILSYAFDEMKM